MAARMAEQMNKPCLRKHLEDGSKKLGAIDNTRAFVDQDPGMHLLRQPFNYFSGGTVSSSPEPAHCLLYVAFGLVPENQLRHHAKQTMIHVKCGFRTEGPPFLHRPGNEQMDLRETIHLR